VLSCKIQNGDILFLANQVHLEKMAVKVKSRVIEYILVVVLIVEYILKLKVKQLEKKQGHLESTDLCQSSIILKIGPVSEL